MPYPPANAEVTLEIRTTTVRHGRKLLRYSASSPLDTIYIKIPNTAPSSLHKPILEKLCNTVDLGHQRIVVGGGVRPGCALLALDLLRGSQELQDAFGELERRLRSEPELVVTEAARGACAISGEAVSSGSGGGGGGGRNRPSSFLEALNALTSAEGGAANEGIDPGTQCTAVLSSGLSRCLESMGVELLPGMLLQVQHLGAVVEAKFCGQEDGWAFRLLQPAAQALSIGTATSTAGASVPAGVSLFVNQQVFDAPTSAKEAVKVFVRIRGVMDLGADVGYGALGGSGSSSSGRYDFTVRGLGRHFPVLGVSVPTTPALDLTYTMGSTGEMVTSVDANNSCGSRGRGGPALVAAVASAVMAVAAADGAGEAAGHGDGGDADAAPAVVASVTVVNSQSNSASACSVSRHQHTPHRVPFSPAPSGGPGSDSGSDDSDSPPPVHWSQELPPPPPVQVPPPVHWSAADTVADAPAAVAAAVFPMADAAVCYYELTVAGLGAGHSGVGSAYVSAASGPLLLQLELWQDNCRLVASKPLLVLPPSLSGITSELQRLVQLQQGLQVEVDEADAKPAAATKAIGTVASAGDAGGSSADQLVTDMGMWLEFVHDELLVAQMEGVEVVGSTVAAVTEPQPPDGAAGSGGDAADQRYRRSPLLHPESSADAGSNVILPGSLDLRYEVLEQRRRSPVFSAAMLRTGLNLLEAMALHGSGTLVEHLLADFRSLGYGAAEVWAAAAAASSADGGGDDTGLSLLHLAAISGDVMTLRAVAELAVEAAAISANDGNGDSSPWLLRDGDGRTPLHLLAAAAGCGGAVTTAVAALEWALGSGSHVVRSAWLDSRDSYGFTPAQVLTAAAAEAAKIYRAADVVDHYPLGEASSPWQELNQARLPKQMASAPTSSDLTMAGAVGLIPPFAGAAGEVLMGIKNSVNQSAISRMEDSSRGPVAAADTKPRGALCEETVCKSVAAMARENVQEDVEKETKALSGPATAAASEAWNYGHQIWAEAVALLWASLRGFDACGGTKYSLHGGQMECSMVEVDEVQYQAYVSRRTLLLAQGWVIVHLLLLASAVRRLLVDGRPHELAAPLLYSSGHMMMLVVLRAVPGFRLYLPYRGFWWVLTAVLRSTSKVVQLLGWIPLPDATLKYVKGGATLVSDCVLPALFEPCPLPWAALILVCDFFVTAAVYLRIGYAAGLGHALLKAALKCSVSFSVRLAMDLMHRSAFLSGTPGQLGGRKSATGKGKRPQALPQTTTGSLVPPAAWHIRCKSKPD
ncbi:hypothetical protein VaNZ11_015406 [Volvox africanus]|uniref:Uncharacterized protein n=1 Tax=Volvox africanus TaxID=51714 RepID=A0ABQ5SKI2_9CHLO|nr:hypothetical protein VaNZ11_015406 [Volvox africanus]